ncbi:hypothetical protein BJX63DRAFT_121791 [Aspergillus granulosus]|uniref:BZIP domain-containing protein n=1 Tax=Aspergillus granulosus TaxID=176169 RepID=A0ABR4I3Y6_9EURO
MDSVNCSCPSRRSLSPFLPWPTSTTPEAQDQNQGQILAVPQNFPDFRSPTSNTTSSIDTSFPHTAAFTGATAAGSGSMSPLQPFTNTPLKITLSLDERKRKRQEQNRRAQQAFRARRAQIQQDLRAQIAELRLEYAKLLNQYHAQEELVGMLKEYIDSLTSKLLALQVESLRNHTAC